MPAKCKLPPDFVWQEEGETRTLHLDQHPIARVVPVGQGGWMVETLIAAPGIEPQRFAVRTVDLGRGSAARWALQRMRLIVRTCGREDLSPPVAPANPRRVYSWQRPSWAQAS